MRLEVPFFARVFDFLVSWWDGMEVPARASRWSFRIPAGVFSSPLCSLGLIEAVGVLSLTLWW